jgi:hypothetical protein
MTQNTVTISISDYEHLNEKCEEFDKVKEQLVSRPEDLLVIYTDSPSPWRLNPTYFVVNPDRATKAFKDEIESVQKKNRDLKDEIEWLMGRSLWDRIFNRTFKW